MHTMAAHTAISVDLLMDLIAFQLIAPHANTKLHQTEVPSASLIANLIPLDIIIRWYWLLMTQQSQNRWVSVRASCHDMPQDRQSCSGHTGVQIALFGSASNCVLLDNMLMTDNILCIVVNSDTRPHPSKIWNNSCFFGPPPVVSTSHVPDWVH